jgi:HK97 family phage major capsid protein
MENKDKQNGEGASRVELNTDRFEALFSEKLDAVGKRLEDKLRAASTPPGNPTIGSDAVGDDYRVVGADGGAVEPHGDAPLGPGWRGPRPGKPVTPDEAKHTMIGFQRLMRGDISGCERAWTDIPGYRANEPQQSDEYTYGGVLVPEGFLNQVIVELPNYTPFASNTLIRMLPMERDVVRVPTVNTKPSQPSVIQEGTSYSKTRAKFGSVELIARKVGEIIPVTYEMIEGSSVALFQFLAELVAEQMADKRTDLITNGVGSDEPQGIRSEADVTTVAQAISTFGSDDLVETFYGIKSAYRRDAFWLIHDSISKVIRKLKDNDGRYMWVDGGGLGPAQPTIMGRPVYENPYIPTDLGSGSDESEILWGSFRRAYWMGTRAGLMMESNSSGTDWEKDITNLKFRERWDGKVADPAGFVRLTGIIE